MRAFLTMIHFNCAILIIAVLFTSLCPSASTLSMQSKFAFQSFVFDQTTGICRSPSSFHYDPLPSKDLIKGGDSDRRDQFFVLRNVPGDGDCIFHAVLSSVFISMGMLNPDAAFTSSNLMSSMIYEMRSVVANFLTSPDGTLYVNNKPRKRLVRCHDLLQSAAKSEGLTTEEYLTKLRLPGRMGGLYGGGPELTVLSNILRRPISIYHLKQPQTTEKNRGVHSIRMESPCKIERVGVFGEGLFEDPCNTIPNSVVSNAVFFTMNKRAKQSSTQSQMEPISTQQEPSSSSGAISSILSSPFKCSWHLHILIADASEKEKHACVLLPSAPILHNPQ
eukprot:CCRYP_005693-RA/>CCRYP_005693-RA protein AED:0.03 eAED:0.03 QI:636/1/1/1/0/0/2/340/333